MKADLIFIRKSGVSKFIRLKHVLRCCSDDTRLPTLNMVQFVKKDEGMVATATNKHVLRSDKFNIKADPGVYSILVNSDEEIRLLKTADASTFPSYLNCVPKATRKEYYVLKGMGSSFVIWAAASLGTYLDPSLIHIGCYENVTLYVHKTDTAAVMIKNRQTLMLAMPMKPQCEWISKVDQIKRSRVIRSIMDREPAV